MAEEKQARRKTGRRRATRRWRLGTLLLAAAMCGTPRLLKAVEPVALSAQAGPIHAVAFSPNGQLLAAGGERSESLQSGRILNLWNVGSRRVARSLGERGDMVLALAFSPDGDQLVSATVDDLEGAIRIWSVHDGRLRRVLVRHAGAIASVAFFPDGKTLASAGMDQTVRLWDLKTGEQERILEADNLGRLGTVSISPEGMVAAFDTSGGSVVVWNPASGERRVSYKAEGLFVAFSPDKQTLAIPSRARWINLVDAHAGKTKWLLKGHGDEVRSVAFSSDGKMLASASADATVKLWDVSSGKLLDTLQAGRKAVNSAAFSPDNKSLAAGSDDGIVRLWPVSGSDKQPR
jgi:WD40 repeat protein